MIRTAISIACLVALGPTPARAKCAFVEPAPHVLTPADTVIEDGGGVIVMATGFARSDDDEPEKQITWRFANAGKRLSPHLDQLAPGLVVYRLPASGLGYTLEDDKHTNLVTVKRSDTRNAPKLAPPVIRSADVSTTDHGRFTMTAVTVHLPTAAPTGAFAMVIYGVDANGARTARSWGLVRAGERDIMVFHQGHCSFPPRGTVETHHGDSVAVAWIDRSGRVSDPSAAINVVVAHDAP
jgi:hypothetical protein